MRHVLVLGLLAAALSTTSTQAQSPEDRAAAFKAAGFAPKGGRYPACDPTQTLEIEVRDINGDARPDALITDAGIACYGRDEVGFAIVTKDANGAWRKLFSSPGFPTFEKTRGVGGWPDIKNGGPGFCHPVTRWNGSDYVRIGWKAEQPGACAGRK